MAGHDGTDYSVSAGGPIEAETIKRRRCAGGEDNRRTEILRTMHNDNVIQQTYHYVYILDGITWLGPRGSLRPTTGFRVSAYNDNARGQTPLDRSDPAGYATPFHGFWGLN